MVRWSLREADRVGLGCSRAAEDKCTPERSTFVETDGTEDTDDVGLGLVPWRHVPYLDDGRGH